MPGTQVIVDGIPGETGYFHALIIRGQLIAKGGEEGINFISITGKTDGWKGIYVEGKAELDNVAVSHAQRGLTAVDTEDITINNCNFTNNYLAVHVCKAQPTITNTLFKDNAWYAIKEDAGGKPVVKGCTFTGNKRDYYANTSTSITIEELNGIPGNQDNRRVSK